MLVVKKSKSLREYSIGVKVTYLAIFAIIILDLYLSYDVIRQDPGYGGLAAIAVQAMFIPAIAFTAILHLKFKNREDENDRRKIQNLPTIPSFNDKIKQLTSINKKIFFGTLIILILTIAGMYATYNFQDNQTKIVDVKINSLDEFEYQLEWVYLYENQIYTTGYDFKNNKYVTMKYDDSNGLQDVSIIYTGLNYIEERRYLENYIFSYAKNFETGEELLNIADSLTANSSSFTVTLDENNIFDDRYQYQIFPFINSELPGAYFYKFRYKYNEISNALNYLDGEMKLIYNGTITDIATPFFVFDILGVNDEIYMLTYVNSLVVIDLYDSKPDGIFLNSSSQNQIVSKDVISVSDPTDDAKGISLSNQNDRIFILASNFIYDTSTNKKLSIDEIGADFLSSGNFNYLLGIEVDNKKLLIISYDGQLTYYDQNTYKETTMSHSPSTNYESWTQRSTPLYYGGEIVTISQSKSQIYFWSTDTDALNKKAKIVLFLTISLIIIAITSLIVLFLIGYKAQKT